MNFRIGRRQVGHWHSKQVHGMIKFRKKRKPKKMIDTHHREGFHLFRPFQKSFGKCEHFIIIFPSVFK